MTEQFDTEIPLAEEGPLGCTQKERVRVFRPARRPLEVEVFRVVNVDDTPELREPALDGSLHALDDGGRVDVPFVYHDPTAEKLALVIPDGARGREPSERAKLAERLANERGDAAPRYARDFGVVYGAEGLARFISEPAEMEVEAEELVPVDGSPAVASRFPRLAALLPPAGFWARAADELAPMVDEDGLWLFAQASEEDHGAFRESCCDLLVQLKMVDQIPVCILTLTDARADAVRRAYLNPAPDADGRLLDLLRREFHANVIVFSAERLLLRSFRLEAPRAANVQRIVERVEHGVRYAPSRWSEAATACRLSPLPVGGAEHPFVIEEGARSAGEALRKLRQLENWVAPDKEAEALEVLSVPTRVFELARRRIVADAARYGLAMSESLLAQAVRFGLADSVAELVAALSSRFEQTVGTASTQELDGARIEANRKELGRLAEVHGTSTDRDLSCNIQYSG